MKRKSKPLTKFIDELHDFIVSHQQFRRNTIGRREASIQAELRPLFVQFLERHFRKSNYRNFRSKAHKSFYWEGQDGHYDHERVPIFDSKNYPDFIITSPYSVAIEYKQSRSASAIKTVIGQSIMHTLCGDFDFVYVLFHDQNKGKQLQKSAAQAKEKRVIDNIWNNYNVRMKIV